MWPKQSMPALGPSRRHYWSCGSVAFKVAAFCDPLGSFNLRCPLTPAQVGVGRQLSVFKMLPM